MTLDPDRRARASLRAAGLLWLAGGLVGTWVAFATQATAPSLLHWAVRFTAALGPGVAMVIASALGRRKRGTRP